MPRSVRHELAEAHAERIGECVERAQGRVGDAALDAPGGQLSRGIDSCARASWVRPACVRAATARDRLLRAIQHLLELHTVTP